MSTKKLAKKLGLLRQRSQSSGSKKSMVSNQIFSYLIVIDFESTCWREKKNCSQEIIEFPAVLLNTSTGEVESEFHAYVQPQEHPILSEFCTELTGITQVQVEAGIPLQICLSRFNRWLQSLQLEAGVAFPNKRQACSEPSPSQKLCAFLTWSDWDLGVCLQYECKRKQLHKPDVLNSWIDLRSTYRLFYNRKPKGLNGALQDLGIQFSGREHSGLDDARNTAQLAARMMRDGCVMRITRSLERTPVMVKATFGSTTGAAENKENLDISEKENVSKPLSSKIPLKTIQKQSCSEDITRNAGTKGKVQTCRSLISPTTLLTVTPAPLWGHSRGSATTHGVAKLSSTALINCTSPHNNSSHVLCSTSVGCFSTLPQLNQTSKTAPMDEKEENAELLVEAEERCGSYDDVVLEGDDVTDGMDRDCDPEFISDFDSGCYEWEELSHSHSPAHPSTVEHKMRGSVSAGRNSEMQNIPSDSSVICESMKTSDSHVKLWTHKKEMIQPTTSYFAVPKPVNWSCLNQRKTGLISSEDLHLQFKGLHKNEETVRPKPFVPGKTSTPNTSSFGPKPIIAKHTQPHKTSFTIYSEPAKQAAGSSHRSTFASLHTPNTNLSSLSANTLSCRANRSRVSAPAKGPQKITSPLCACGRRAKRQVVSNGGPNHGRGFYCCAVRRSGGGGRMEKGCEFFKWESALMRSPSPALRSSVSLCQINTSVPQRPAHRAALRKSC
ncbi:ERI1 exoribonuclease 2 [Odontesthes bonariensis]|uniref:ERI1 exoribonuclease 2 n=1 Tax=Odontesthes bonariensis TaxID=219752 RepID=UPI003F582F27